MAFVSLYLPAEIIVYKKTSRLLTINLADLKKKIPQKLDLSHATQLNIIKYSQKIFSAMKLAWQHKFWLIWTFILVIIISWNLQKFGTSITDYFMFFFIGAVFSTAFTVWSDRAVTFWNNGSQVLAILLSLFGVFLIIGFGTKFLLDHIWPDVS